jgi:TonB family protein
MSRITMRCGLIIGIVLLSWSSASPQKNQAPAVQPNQFEIGRRTFFDFGPPFDFYELLIVRPTTGGSSVERVTLTPPGDECIAPAKLEVASATISEPPAALLGSTNPCTIPDKELSRELKRCKKCLVFSGAQVVMRVECGTQTRLIRSDILDRDMFDKAAKTPERTSWTMRLLGRLDETVGPGVMDKPVFPTIEKEQPLATGLDSLTQREVSAGKYDALFPGGATKPSGLYSAAQNHPPLPTIRLVSSVPFAPKVLVLPEYPPLARLAHIRGVVSFKVEVDANGDATSLAFETGHPILQAAARNAVSGWKFPSDAANQSVEATIQFDLNCPPK